MATRQFAEPMGYKQVAALDKPDTRTDRGWAKVLPKNWYHSDYPTFLELLEAREKELGINHDRTNTNPTVAA